VAVVETRTNENGEQSSAETMTSAAKEGGAAGEASKEITPMDTTPTASAAVPAEATDGGKASKTAKGKEKEKGDGAAAAQTDDNSKEKKRKKRNGKSVEEPPVRGVTRLASYLVQAAGSHLASLSCVCLDVVARTGGRIHGGEDHGQEEAKGTQSSQPIAT
jgi:hypothetical protein